MAEDDEHMSDGLNGDDDAAEERIINEEYKTWKKNAPYLYDMILSTALDWPTLTVQWFPDKQSIPGTDYSKHRVLIGTHTIPGRENYLQIAEVQLPNPVYPNAKDYNPETGEIGGYGASSTTQKQIEIKFNVIQKIDHPGEVNKARYQPQNPDIIATMCTDGRILIYDRTKHSSTPRADKTPKPDIELLGHEKEGYGLSWSPHIPNQLATASEDKTVRIWDISSASKTSRQISPLKSYTHHSSIVNDVQYHPLHRSLLGTVSDDLTFALIDLRSPNTSKAALSVGDQSNPHSPTAHTDAINTLSFNPSEETLVATGSADRTIALWDMRFLSAKQHSFEGHNDSVTSLSWHPFEPSILASSSYDRRICFWDLLKIGEEQTPEDAEDGPPELMFMHGGHTNRISDFSWNMNDPWVVCSAADDNLVQVWKASEAVLGEYFGEEEGVEREQLEG